MREPAEPSRSAPAPERSGIVAAIHGFPWLAPGVASLVSLARPCSGDPWQAIRTDPGAVLLLLRNAERAAPEAFRERLLEPACLELALHHLDDPVFLDWSGIVAAQIYRFSLRTAGLAAQLASQTTGADVAAAWSCGLLAPLGWMAVCAIDPGAAEGCIRDTDHAVNPGTVQRHWWGLDQAAIARRLARRWRLPNWLAIGRLGLPAEAAVGLGAQTNLFHVTRLAAGLAGRRSPNLGLVDPADVAASAAALGMSLSGCTGESTETAGRAPREAPRSQPLLREFLTTALENRRLHAAPRRDQLEDEADVLHRTLEIDHRSRATRLQEEKLTALAEFAAGAGHEINNPLAVILGQAQYLLGHEMEWFAPDPEDQARIALQKIIGQTRRIHGILRDLMQFARPAPPSPAWHDLPQLLSDVAEELAEFAEQREVTLGVDARPGRFAAFLDDGQAKIALTCLLRNAIEAAPSGGRARLVFHDRPTSETLQVVVEDNGAGPDEAARKSLFDPFFSGRAAGRGRGLGLPTAWRLARQQGGDVHLEPPGPGEPTRFILTLPRVSPPPEPEAPPLVESVLAAPLPPPPGTSANGCHTS